MSLMPGSDNFTEASLNPPVLVAVDYSKDSESAVVWACKFAKCVDAPLVILHVVHDPASSPGFYLSDMHQEISTMQDVAERMMSEFLVRLRESEPTLERLRYPETLLLKGLPPGRIVDMAEELGAQIIVIGSRGMTGLPHLLLGSVAERVVELSDRPVVVVKNESNSGKKKKKKGKQKNKKQRLNK